jgi:hypothetical protein
MALHITPEQRQDGIEFELAYRTRPAEWSPGAAACVGVEVHEDELQQIALSATYSSAADYCR